MNYQYLRIFRTLLLALIALGVIRCAQLHAAVVGAIASTNDLINYINPNSANTNYFLMSDTGTIADGTAAIWTYDSASSTDDADHIKPLLFTGRWVRNFRGLGGTNVFNTIFVTNSYVSNFYNFETNLFQTFTTTNITFETNVMFNETVNLTTNTYITTNVFIISGGDTNLAGLWTDFPTFIAPTSFTNVFHVGKDGFINIAGSGFSEVQVNGPSAGGMVDIYEDDTQHYIRIQSPLYGGTLVTMLEPTIAADTVIPYRFGTVEENSTTPLVALFNGTNSVISTGPVLSFGPTAQIIWGPGTTNVLYRSGSNLIYTNGNTLVAFQVVNSAGNIATFEVDGGGHPEVLAENGHIVYLSVSGANSLAWTGSILEAPGTAQLGAPGVLWDNSYFGTGYFYGFDSGPDYSRLKISHTGTNGAVVFDSTSAGIAGDPREFVFATNTVGKALISTNGAFANDASTNLWVFKGVTEGASTNVVVNINGKDYTFQAW